MIFNKIIKKLFNYLIKFLQNRSLLFSISRDFFYLTINFDNFPISHYAINFISGEGNKSLPLNANWTSPKQNNVTNDKRKPLDDSYAGVSYKISRESNEKNINLDACATYGLAERL